MRGAPTALLAACLAPLAAVGGTAAPPAPAAGGTAAPPAPAAGGEILLLGDSWASEGGPAFAAMLQAHGVADSVVNKGVTGSTAQHWASPPALSLVRALAARPAVRHVWVTLGGNDAFHQLPVCALGLGTAASCSAQVLAKVQVYLTTILTAIHEANPRARVVGFGYDILRLGGSAECSLVGFGLFPGCRDGPQCINAHFVAVQQMWDGLAAQMPWVDSINLLGTLQAAGGVPGAAVGHPVLSQWSPAALMQSDCVHPTLARGFPAVFDAMWSQYWVTRLPRPAPRPAAPVPALPRPAPPPLSTVGAGPTGAKVRPLVGLVAVGATALLAAAFFSGLAGAKRRGSVPVAGTPPSAYGAL